MNLRTFEENNINCPSNDAGDCLARACISRCSYQYCPFVFWQKVEEVASFKAKFFASPAYLKDAKIT